ncbi:MAG: AMP-binding protein [Candidatus Heimdallarchaeaceae archaeon]
MKLSDESNYTLSYPNHSLYQNLLMVANKIPEKIAVVEGQKNYSYKELITDSNKLAFFLDYSGIGKEDTVAILLNNSYYSIISLFACFQVGAKVALLNPRLSEKDISNNFIDSDAIALITESELKEKFSTAIKHHAFNIKIITDSYAYIKPTENDYVLIESILEKNDFYTEDQSQSNSVALLLYTGGTTGLPKAVVLSHYNLLANSIQFNTALDRKERNPEKTIVLGVLPFYHSFGLMVCVFSPLFKGSKIVVLPKFDPKKVWEIIIKENITELYAVPTMYVALTVEKIPVKNLKLEICVSGGAPLAKELGEKFYRLTGVKICEGYGLTECSPVTHLNPPDSPKLGSIGLPLPDTKAKIIDPETEQNIMIEGEIGELVIKGPQVMLGYYKKGIESIKTFTSDGWLRTGDLASIDDEGFFFIVDRLKEVIISGGLKIYPREVEELVFKIPGIAYTALIGIPDEYYGEVGKLYVVQKEGYNISKEQITEFLKNKIATYKIPKEIEFVDSLPLSGPGKIAKRELEKLNNR